MNGVPLRHLPSKTICFDEDILLCTVVCVCVGVSCVWKFHIWFPFIASILPKRRICHFVECIIMRCLSFFSSLYCLLSLSPFITLMLGGCVNQKDYCLLRLQTWSVFVQNICSVFVYALYQCQCQCHHTYIQVWVDVFRCATRTHKNE